MDQPIAIVGGTGAEGFGLALRWLAAGLQVRIGSRDSAKAQAAAAGALKTVPGAHVEGLENSQAVSDAQIVVLTVPFASQVATIRSIRGAFAAGTTLIVTTVPVGSAVGDRVAHLLTPWEGSAAEQAASYLPSHVAVVSAFHNLAASALADLDHPVDCDVLVCGDDDHAKRKVMELVRAIPGARAIDAGLLDNSRFSESLAAMLIGLNIRHKVKHSGVRITGLPDEAGQFPGSGAKVRGPIVALAGGVGAARFLEGLSAVLPPDELVIIGNTGDDVEMHGLHVSPDLDTVTYTLAGLIDGDRGWGLKGDTFSCLEALARLGCETWFALGDHDFATHLFRTQLLRSGMRLSEVTARICNALGVQVRALIPMTDDRVRTQVNTPAGWLDFQEYFVKRRAEDAVCGVKFEGVEQSVPAPGVLEAIRDAAGVIVCPSNPIISIGPILAVPGVRQALRDTAAPVVAISPIVGGRALKGPADRMMQGIGLESSAKQVAELYSDFLDAFILDNCDAAMLPAVEQTGVRAVAAETIMSSGDRKTALARCALEVLSA